LYQIKITEYKNKSRKDFQSGLIQKSW